MERSGQKQQGNVSVRTVALAASSCSARVARDYAIMRVEHLASIADDLTFKMVSESDLASLTASFHEAQLRVLSVVAPSDKSYELRATTEFESSVTKIRKRLREIMETECGGRGGRVGRTGRGGRRVRGREGKGRGRKVLRATRSAGLTASAAPNTRTSDANLSKPPADGSLPSVIPRRTRRTITRRYTPSSASSAITASKIRPIIKSSHYIMPFPRIKGVRVIARRCRVCYARGVRKESTYECETCKVPLCVGQCFKEYHTLRSLV